MKISKIQIIGNLIGILPGVYLVFQASTGKLSANPIQTTTVVTGRASIYAILISLYCTPLAQLFRLSVFHPIRKITGLFGFYYALAHFMIFSILDYQLNISWILPELRQKPFLQIGLIALVLLIPLAITSINKIRRNMKGTWKTLHRIVYIIAALVLLHVALASKGDIINPAILSGFYLVAMILRIPFFKTIQISTPPEWMRKINAYLIS